jgi:leucyl aminopeptidase
MNSLRRKPPPLTFPFFFIVPTATRIYLVGKGVTYDTGGADLKTGGAMRGMSRDKCGAATVCGIVKAIELLEIPGIKVVGTCAFVRNSIGADAYVSDEVITARSGTKGSYFFFFFFCCVSVADE